jgi:hypothetical protein
MRTTTNFWYGVNGVATGFVPVSAPGWLSGAFFRWLNMREIIDAIHAGT